MSLDSTISQTTTYSPESPISNPSSLLNVMQKELEARLRQRRLQSYRPYSKQREFHAAGATFRERALIAANQVGKTLCAGSEVAMHLTGIYPDWWDGKRFDRAVRWIAGSETAELTRKGVQRILLGPPESELEWGTGTIPRANIRKWVRRQGVADTIDTIVVKHVSGNDSSIQLAAYEQGRTRWQADTVDGVWFDEEPPEDIYTEGITRTNVALGPIMLTLTPLLGMSTVVRRFYPVPMNPETMHLTVMTIDDAEHYSPEQRAAIVDSYPAHEREARTKGIPTLGSGRIFPVPEEDIVEEAIVIPDHWARIAGMDIGWDHPTAVAWIAWDRDSDVVHVYDCHRQKQATPIVHAAAIKARGDWIPVAWPHDALQHDKGGSCEQIAGQYRDQGVAMLDERATFNDGTSGVEAGLMEMLDRMQTGRLKVARHLTSWFDEFRVYHRKDGKVVKEYDDLLSATRYGLMMLRKAKTKPRPRTAEKSVYAGPQGWLR